MKYLLHNLALSLLFATPLFGMEQEQPIRKNAICIAPFSKIDKTYSVSYSRSLNKHFEITVKPRIRIVKQNDLKVSTNELFSDPFWFYNRYMIRVGLMGKADPIYTIGGLFAEGALQYDYGYFKNKIFLYDNREGQGFDTYYRADRYHHSVGLIGMLGFVHNFNRIRIKLYGGFGLHHRFYRETKYDEGEYNHITAADPANEFIVRRNYERNVLSINTGLEIGFRF